MHPDTKANLDEKIVSIIIPAYNEEHRIPSTLKKIVEYCNSHVQQFEIIVVDDGSTDRTSQATKDCFLNESFSVGKVLGYRKNRGKGAAIQYGVEHAIGDYILFSDADLSTPIEELDRFFDILISNPEIDIVIGSRAEHSSNILEKQPFYREWMGRVFNVIVRLLLKIEFLDTQCGFKLFSKKAAHKIFPMLSISGFSFDVEVIILAKNLGFLIRQVPITWVNDSRSSVSLLGSSLEMFFDVIRIWNKHCLIR